MFVRPVALPLLFAAAVVILGAGCQDGDSLIDPEVRSLADSSPRGSKITSINPPGGFDFESFTDRETGVPAFIDGPTWQSWNFTSREQTWSQADRTKLVSFKPNPNLGYSPEFDPVYEARVTFDLYLPSRFPVFGVPREAASTVIGLGSYDATVDGPPEHFTGLGIDLYQGLRWRIRAESNDAREGGIWSSDDQFLMPWIFRHGWNHVEWMVFLRPGLDNDAMRIKVGDRIYSWTDVDLSHSPAGIQHVFLGSWEAGIGDQHFAVRNLRVDDLAPQAPPPPPPPPEGDYARGGYRFTDGFWSGWRVDSARNFIEIGGHGGMVRNASGIRYIGVDEDGSGSYGFRVRFTEPDQLNRAGGKHLAGIASNPLAFRPRDPYGRRYPVETTRIDLGRPSDGRIRAHLYNVTSDETLHEEIHWFSVPFALDVWADVDLRWQQVGRELTLTLNGQSHTFRLLADSPNLGSYLYLGNMDDITGAIEFDNFHYSQ
jgi:hypothetical protein